MKPFTMTVDYIDPASGEMVTEDVSIDDFGYAEPSEPFVPLPEDNDEYPW